MRRFIVPALVCALACAPVTLAAVESVPAATQVDAKMPESAILLPAKVLKDNDFKSFFLSLPAEDQAKAKADWNEARAAAQQPEAANKSAEFNEMLAKLLAPNAVDTLLAEAKPKLAEVNPQEMSQGLMMMGGFLPMMLQANQQPGAQDPAQQATVTAYVTLLQGMCADASQWVMTAGLNDEAKLKQALTHLVAGARALGVKDVAELQALELEEFLARLSPLVKEAKLALGVYDIGVDAFLSSLTAKAEGTGDKRTLQVGLTVFGKPYTIPVRVQQKAGLWVISPETGEPFKGLMGQGGQDDGMGGGPAMPLEEPAPVELQPSEVQPAPVTP